MHAWRRLLQLLCVNVPHIVGGVVYSEKVAQTDEGGYPATEY
jgi:hypothetical protein